MKVLQILKSKIQHWECHYSDGKKSKCWRYNLADIFDSMDD